MASFFHLVVTLSLMVGLASAAGRSITSANDEYLNAHNAERSKLKVAHLKWSADLTSNANFLVKRQQRQSNCAFADLSTGNNGANQAIASFKPAPSQVVASWISEKKWYIHANNSCVAGHKCGTFTQVVWRNTKELGCAQAVCGGGINISAITICLYHPAGNVLGQSPY